MCLVLRLCVHGICNCRCACLQYCTTAFVYLYNLYNCFCIFTVCTTASVQLYSLYNCLCAYLQSCTIAGVHLYTIVQLPVCIFTVCTTVSVHLYVLYNCLCALYSLVEPPYALCIFTVLYNCLCALCIFTVLYSCLCASLQSCTTVHTFTVLYKCPCASLQSCTSAYKCLYSLVQLLLCIFTIITTV